MAFSNHSKDFQGIGAMGRAGWLQQKVMGFQIVRHDHENQCPERGPDGRCIMAAPGESGELLGLIKPNDPVSQFHGYTDKAATKKKIIEGCVAEGDRYFTTGDLVRKEDDGYVYFDIIFSSV